MTQSVVDDVDGGVDEMVDDAPREREVDETGKPGLRGGRVHRHSLVGLRVWRMDNGNGIHRGLFIIKFHGKVRDSDFRN